VALSEGIGYAVSDGSFQDTAGAAAWIIEGSTLTVRLIGKWHTPRPPDAHSSFRSKLAGIVGILYTLTFWAPMTIKPHFRITCDGLSVITRLQTSRPIEPTEPHFDLLTVARSLLALSYYTVDLVFVRGHQDTKFLMVLTPDAWFNMEANALAKSKVSPSFTGPSVYKLPGNSWGCYVQKKRIVTQLPSSLQKHINGQAVLSY